MHHGGMGWMPGRSEGAVLLTVVSLGAIAGGCSGRSLNKAGGSAPSKPTVLTLAAHDDDEAYGTFAAAVARLSGGSLRIKIAANWRVSGDRREIDFERGMVSDVRRGRVPLAIVSIRIWDTLGTDSFEALLAPFLIDSLALEQRALASPFAARALASVDRLGVVGIALLPGRLRRPLGVTRLLVRPRDYQGAKMGIRLGKVAAMTFRALGATPIGYVPGDLSGLDGAELDPLTITQNDYDVHARALTSNVVFWPRAQTVIMNRKAFDRLSRDQQEILREAGREAVAPELLRIAHDQQSGLAALCTRGTLPIATAQPAALAALRLAVRPVYDRLKQDSLTKAWIESITRMRSALRTAPAILRCP